MRKQLLAMASIAALGVAVGTAPPAGAIQIAPAIGPANADLIQVQGQGGLKGGPGPSAGRSGGPSGRSFSGGPGGPGRNWSGPPRTGGDFGARARAGRGDIDRRSFSGRDGNRFERFDGRRRDLVRRGWSRDRRHVFFGAFLAGIPFGYAAVSTHPCYDWRWGPYGWGYYWNYWRCPV